MRVLGIDPGSRNTGLGVVEYNQDGLVPLCFERIKMGSEPLPERLGKIHMGVRDIIQRFQPTMVAVEQVFISNNAKSALILGQARGSAVSAAITINCQVYEYTALQIKHAVVGSGSATKEQVQHMVRVLVGLRTMPSYDEADALACAICHIHTLEGQRKLAYADARNSTSGVHSKTRR